MRVKERVPLSSLTTLRVGGEARYVIECASEDDVREAIAFARERDLSFAPLGEGSNILASDDGYEGVVLLVRGGGIDVKEEGEAVYVTTGAGVPWDALVREAGARGLWGIENLAGIPGTVGAAPVQNIGAYGAELKDALSEVVALNTRTGEVSYFSREACAFGYRDSIFKREPGWVILSVTLALEKIGVPLLGYADLAKAQEAGADLSTPAAIGEAVRAIRAKKFPDLSACGTAGSFFKNPVIAGEAYDALKARHPDMPGYPSGAGMKIPLAFVLDRMLGLRGYREGKVRLFENQPLVLVADEGATAREIDSFANGIASRVAQATGIDIEREVRAFP